MQRRTAIALICGVAAVAAAVIYAGAGAVLQAVASLHLSGLLLLVLLHVPAVVMMGLGWWFASGDDPPATPLRFLWARFVRDAAGELLPFLQLGGVVFGLRALGRGRTLLIGAVSASIDGVVELAAKLPYVLAALLALATLAPHSRLAQLLWLALLATAVTVAIFLFARQSFGALLERMARAISARWPAMLGLDEGGGDFEVRECFERILRQRARLWWAFTLHLCCWFFGAAEMWVTFWLLGADLSLAQALAIDGTVVALRTFGWVVPGAAGVQEASYMLVAALFAIPPAVGLAASFARRGRDLVLGIGTFGIAALGDADVGLLTLTMPKRQRPRAR